MSAEQDDIFEVEKLLNRRKEKGKTLYRVKWLGYDMKEATWEPVENLSDVMEMVFELDEKLDKKKVPQKKWGKKKRPHQEEDVEGSIIKLTTTPS